MANLMLCGLTEGISIIGNHCNNVVVSFNRARVKAGMRILGATPSSDAWNVHIEKENPKHTVARVTAYRKDQDPDSEADSITKPGDNSNK